jgi:hypothetical protein
MNDFIELSKIERQLLLYEIFLHCEVTEFIEITSRLPVNKRMIQRDIVDLREAGLVDVFYSKKERGYIKKDTPRFNENAVGKRRQSLKRLYRLGTLMTELENDDAASWEKEFDREDGDEKEYFTAKDSYYELFPDSSERTRQRDFKTLRRIGYQVGYDNWDHCFVKEYDYTLRDDFEVEKRNGKLMRRSAE